MDNNDVTKPDDGAKKTAHQLLLDASGKAEALPHKLWVLYLALVHEDRDSEAVLANEAHDQALAVAALIDEARTELRAPAPKPVTEAERIKEAEEYQREKWERALGGTDPNNAEALCKRIVEVGRQAADLYGKVADVAARGRELASSEDLDDIAKAATSSQAWLKLWMPGSDLGKVCGDLALLGEILTSVIVEGGAQ